MSTEVLRNWNTLTSIYGPVIVNWFIFYGSKSFEPFQRKSKKNCNFCMALRQLGKDIKNTINQILLKSYKYISQCDRYKSRQKAKEMQL